MFYKLFFYLQEHYTIFFFLTFLVHVLFLVGITGFEPVEWWSQSPLPYRLAISQNIKYNKCCIFIGCKNTLAELWDLPLFVILLELIIGFEPTTCSLQMSCSTNWATSALVDVSGVEPELIAYKATVLTIELYVNICISS